MPAARNIANDQRRISPQMVKASVRSPESLSLFLMQFISILNEQLTTLFDNDRELRRYWYPGDVKLSMRRYDPGQDLSQMPGFVPWVPGLELSKADYPALYDAIGSANPEDDNDVTTFILPDHKSAYVRIAGASEPTGMIDGVLDSGSGVEGITLSIWLKT